MAELLTNLGINLEGNCHLPTDGLDAREERLVQLVMISASTHTRQRQAAR